MLDREIQYAKNITMHCRLITKKMTKAIFEFPTIFGCTARLCGMLHPYVKSSKRSFDERDIHEKTGRHKYRRNMERIQDGKKRAEGHGGYKCAVLS